MISSGPTKGRDIWLGDVGMCVEPLRPPFRIVFLLTTRLLFPGVRDSQTLRSLLCHGHCADDGGRPQCLLPRLPKLLQLPVR